MNFIKDHAYYFKWGNNAKYHYINKVKKVDSEHITYYAIHANDPNKLDNLINYPFVDTVDYVLNNCKEITHLGPADTVKQTHPEYFI